MLNSLVRQLISEGRPARIQNGLRHAGFGESGGIHVADRDVIKLPDDAGRKFVMEIVSAIRYLRMDRLHPTFLLGALCDGQLMFRATIDALSLNLLACGEGGKVFQAKVDADTAHRLASAGDINWDIDHDVEKPVPARIPRKARAVPDLPFGQGAAVEHTERIPSEAERIAISLQGASFDRNPAKRSLPSVAQIWSFFLSPRPGVLLAHRINGQGVQTKFFTAASSKVVQIKACKPAAAPLKRIFLAVIAVIPDEVHRSGLLVQQPS